MKTKIYTLAFLITLILPIGLLAQNDCFPKKPVNSLVLDQASVLNQGEINQLNNKLVNFANSTSTQIVVVILNDLCGSDPAMFATELGQKWGVGQADKDNGVVILVKPTGGQGQRKVHIATGYGLEGVIPDAIGKRIVEKEMIPRFSNGDLFGGIDEAVNTIMELAQGEYTAEEYDKKSNSPGAIPVVVFVILIVIISFMSKLKGARTYATNNNMSLWMALMMMGSMSSHRGHYSNFNSGRGTFGGGGGFGGFGGGGFGGGGAGGSW